MVMRKGSTMNSMNKGIKEASKEISLCSKHMICTETQWLSPLMEISHNSSNLKWSTTNLLPFIIITKIINFLNNTRIINSPNIIEIINLTNNIRPINLLNSPFNQSNIKTTIMELIKISWFSVHWNLKTSSISTPATEFNHLHSKKFPNPTSKPNPISSKIMTMTIGYLTKNKITADFLSTKKINFYLISLGHNDSLNNHKIYKFTVKTALSLLKNIPPINLPKLSIFNTSETPHKEQIKNL